MGASASISLCKAPSSVRVWRHVKVVPALEPPAPVQGPGPVFGVSLERMREAGQLECGVPLVLRQLVEFLDRHGLQQYGVFRLSGSVVRTRLVRVCWDRGEVVDLGCEGEDVPTVAALLKLFLRELPQALIPDAHRAAMERALTECNGEMELSLALKETLSRLPDDNYNVLSYVLHFLSRVASHSQSNHMSVENLATVFGPCLFHVPEGPRMLEEQTVCNHLTLRLLEQHHTLMPHTHLDAGDATHLNAGDTTHTHLNAGDTIHTLHSLDTPPPPPPLSVLSHLLESPHSPRSECEVGTGGSEREGPPSLTGGSGTSTPTSARAPPKPSSSAEMCVPGCEGRLDVNSQEEEGEEEEVAGHPVSEMSRSTTEDSDESPSLKLQALEAELHSPPSPAPSSPRAERDVDVQAPRADWDTDARSPEADTGTQSQRAEERSSAQASSTENSLVQADPSPGSSLLQHITDGDSPLPSPSCPILSQSQRFNSDPDSAPSPPCNQHYIMSRCAVRVEAAGGAREKLSVSLLRRHIHSLKHRIRSFEDSFQQEKNYRPAHNDKTADPEMAKLMSELAKAHKQLKDLRLKQSVAGLKVQSSKVHWERCSSSAGQQRETEPGHGQHTTPVEDTVNTLTQRLREKRLELSLPEHLQDMSHSQLVLEKITLQKCLLYFEGLHGRPRSREERSLMRPLYDRYRLIKRTLCTASSSMTTITTIEEEEGSEEECVQRSPRPPCRLVSMTTQEDDSDPAFVSPLEEVKRSPTDVTTNLHSASRPELLEQLKEAWVEKKRLRKILRKYEQTFLTRTGRSLEKVDRDPMAEEYCQYKNLKAKLRLLEILLSKPDTPKSS